MVTAGVLAELARLPVSPAGLMALAVVTATVAATVAALAVVVACAASMSRAAALPVLRRVATLREKSWRVAFLRQRDPDSAGHSRPRAPSAAPAAAGC